VPWGVNQSFARRARLFVALLRHAPLIVFDHFSPLLAATITILEQMFQFQIESQVLNVKLAEKTRKKGTGGRREVIAIASCHCPHFAPL
jgi:hypothetical protein